MNVYKLQTLHDDANILCTYVCNNNFDNSSQKKDLMKLNYLLLSEQGYFSPKMINSLISSKKSMVLISHESIVNTKYQKYE